MPKVVAHWTDPDGSLLVERPVNGTQRKVTHFEHVEDFLSSKILRSIEVVAIAGVGSSALGTAALATNVAYALGRRILGIVSGYGLVDAVGVMRLHQGALMESWRSVLQGAGHAIRPQLVSASLTISSSARARH